MTNWIESWRGAVAPWECDAYGHMNVQFYMARISEAAATMFAALGVGLATLARRRIGLVAVHQAIDYRRELLAGDAIFMESAVAEAAGRKVRIAHRLRRALDGALAMEAEALMLCMDLDARKSRPLPEDILAAARDLRPLAPPEPLLPTQRSGVNPWECDRMGHLNVQFYVARASEAEANLLAALGLEPRAAPWPAEHRVLFKRELHDGAATAARSGLRAAAPDRLRAFTELRNAETGATAALIESDLRAASPLPDAVVARARELAARFAGPPPPPDLPPPGVPERPRPGMFEAWRGTAYTWEADIHGRLAPRFHMARFSDAASHLLARAGLDAASMRREGWGSAALDYRVRYLRPILPGDALTIRSGLLELREKVWRFCHLVLDEAEAVVATAEVTAVLFDLGTRKSFALPPEVRARVAPYLIAG